MGFLDKLVKAVSGSSSTPKGGGKASKGGARVPKDDEVPAAMRGPDPGTLLTAEEIEAATGSAPVGEGDRRSGGMSTDVGFFRVCIWQLADGGQLIVNSTRIRGDDGLELWRSRWDDPSWNVEREKPIDGVGEAAKWYAKKAKGGTELSISAKQGWYTAALVHTDPAGSKDISKLADLLRVVLSRQADPA